MKQHPFIKRYKRYRHPETGKFVPKEQLPEEYQKAVKMKAYLKIPLEKLL